MIEFSVQKCYYIYAISNAIWNILKGDNENEFITFRGDNERVRS